MRIVVPPHPQSYLGDDAVDWVGIVHCMLYTVYYIRQVDWVGIIYCIQSYLGDDAVDWAGIGGGGVERVKVGGQLTNVLVAVLLTTTQQVSSRLCCCLC